MFYSLTDANTKLYLFHFEPYLSLVSFCVLGSEIETDTLKKAVEADRLQANLRPLMNKYLTAICSYAKCSSRVVQVIQKIYQFNKSKTGL